MNLHQFRFVREAVRQNFNLTEAAKTLFTSQPGVSKAILIQLAGSTKTLFALRI
jgi:LysR family cys regulon transcriptional activator